MVDIGQFYAESIKLYLIVDTSTAKYQTTGVNLAQIAIAEGAMITMFEEFFGVQSRVVQVPPSS
ncbi:hypothetical protein JAB5_50560 [Janthinobacterium sp. HH103]|nr:hypothetical protein JAB5_50560 [Janthinobacterium sp. HH103]OEZ68677.1 hypothetical protein JAB2_17350 [Janthinobacterium sp. HH100]QOU75497.1 hypothetical protein JAB4_049820 [Janthinobacterium sp. HH102]